MGVPFNLSVNFIEYGDYQPNLPEEQKTTQFLSIPSHVSNHVVLYSKCAAITALANQALQTELQRSGIERINIFVNGKIFVCQTEESEIVDENWYLDPSLDKLNILQGLKTGNSVVNAFEAIFPVIKNLTSGMGKRDIKQIKNHP